MNQIPESRAFRAHHAPPVADSVGPRTAMLPLLIQDLHRATERSAELVESLDERLQKISSCEVPGPEPSQCEKEPPLPEALALLKTVLCRVKTINSRLESIHGRLEL